MTERPPWPGNAEQFRFLFDTMAQGVVFQDRQGAIIAANPSAERILGLTLSEMMGVNSVDPRWRSVHADGSPFPGEAHPSMVALRTGQPVHDVLMGVYDPRNDQQRWITIDAVPQFAAGEATPYQVFVTFTDVTARRQAEAKILRLNRLYATLSQINQVIFHAGDRTTLLEGACHVVVQAGQFRMAWIGVLDQAHQTVQPVAVAGEELGFLAAIRHPTEHPCPGQCPTRHALETGACWVCQDIAADSTLAAWRAPALERGYRSVAAVPFFQHGRVVGALTVYAHEAHSFDAGEVRLLEEIGLNLSFALDRLDGEAARQQSEAALRESEISLKAAQRIARLGNWELDLVANRLAWSDEVYRIFGIVPQAFAASYEGFLAAIHPEDRELVNQAYQHSLATRQPYDLVHRVVTPAGEVKYVNEKCETIYDEAGRPLRSRGVVRDITEQYTADQALRESEARFRQILENIQLAALQLDVEGNVTFCNEFTERLTGWPRSAILGHNWFELTLPEAQRAAAIQAHQARIRGDQPAAITMDRELITRWGETRQVRGHITPLLNPAGGTIGVTILDEDITEYMRAEGELIFRNMAMEASLSAIAIANMRGQLTYVNPAFLRLWGYTVIEEVLQRSATEFWSQPAEAAQVVIATTAVGQWVGELQGRRKDGSEFEVELSTAIVRDDTGQPLGLIGSFVDITERKRAAAQLRALNAELEARVAARTADLSRANVELARAARLKDEFLSSMSHELRTPLNGILSLTESLDEGVYGPLTPVQTGPLRAVMEAGQHLLELINDILDLSKIEAGKLELRVGPMAVEAVCEASLRLVRQAALGKGLRLGFAIEEVGGEVVADERRLKQMLVNLLGNAVKFTPEGGQVGLEVRPEGEAVRFEVWDTGIGIAADKLGLLFQPFTQIDSGLARQYGGTGLGLSLVRRLAELHGGSVGVTSVEGQGSRFWFVIPRMSKLALMV